MTVTNREGTMAIVSLQPIVDEKEGLNMAAVKDGSNELKGWRSEQFGFQTILDKEIFFEQCEGNKIITGMGTYRKDQFLAARKILKELGCEKGDYVFWTAGRNRPILVKDGKMQQGIIISPISDETYTISRSRE